MSKIGNLVLLSEMSTLKKNQKKISFALVAAPKNFHKGLKMLYRREKSRRAAQENGFNPKMT